MLDFSVNTRNCSIRNDLRRLFSKKSPYGGGRAASPLVLRTRRLQSIFRRPRSAAFRSLRFAHALRMVVVEFFYSTLPQRRKAGNLHSVKRHSRAAPPVELRSKMLCHDRRMDRGASSFALMATEDRSKIALRIKNITSLRPQGRTSHLHIFTRRRRSSRNQRNADCSQCRR